MNKENFKIISGGQTGVDRAALDVALGLNIPCGGWCPKGRKAEDGPIPDRYPLKETESGSYPVRTEMNVKEADGTLILNYGKLTGGTALTAGLARKHKKPYIIIDLQKNEPAEWVREWIEKRHIRVMNVAGPREGKIPRIHKLDFDFLMEVLSEGSGEEPDQTMEDYPLLDLAYRDAFLYLNQEMARVKTCSDKKKPWQPEDPEQFERAMKTYANWHPESGDNFILNFPWPKPGRVPVVPPDIFRPTPEDRKKIERFIEEYDGLELDEVTQGIIELAKMILKEVH